MRRIILGLATALALTGHAAAQDGENGEPEHWTYVLLSDGATGWNDGWAAYEDDTDAYDVRRFIYFNEVNTAQELPFHWVFQTIRINCVKNTFQLLEGDYYDGQRELVAQMMAENEPRSITDQTTEWLAKMALCDGSTIDAQQGAASLETVLDAVEAAAS